MSRPAKLAVQQWGNSLAVRIPQLLAEKLGLSEGSTIDMDGSEESIVITKAKFTLNELLATYDAREQEADWGPGRGKEAW